MQTPKIRIETLYEAVGYDSDGTPNWKEIRVTKYNRLGQIVYDFSDLFHNMQLTESEYDEKGRHIKTTVRNLLLPDEEPIVIEGEIKRKENHIDENSNQVDPQNEHIYGDFDQYGNWHSEKWIETIVREIKGQEVEREIRTHHYRRAITYFAE